MDILVGWHIDSAQTPSVRSHMSEVLLSWNSYWIIDMEFSSSLLKQFMEDLDAFDKEVDSCDRDSIQLNFNRQTEFVVPHSEGSNLIAKISLIDAESAV